MKEIWKDITGFNKYQVSNTGKVKHKLKNKCLKGRPNKKGYLKVALYNNDIIKNFSIHRLVALHFKPNFDCKLQVNHIDGNKLNNNIDNLEWVSPRENQFHAYANGLCSRKGENSYHKITEEEAKIIKKIKYKIKLKYLASFFNVSQSTISHIWNNRNWSHV